MSTWTYIYGSLYGEVSNFETEETLKKMIGDELPVSRIARITNKGKVRNAEKTKEEKLRNKKKTGAD